MAVAGTSGRFAEMFCHVAPRFVLTKILPGVDGVLAS